MTFILTRCIWNFACDEIIRAAHEPRVDELDRFVDS